MPSDATADLFAKAPWNGVSDDDLAPAAHVPTMISPDERRLYFWLAAHWATGAGALVDLGCFAGGSTARLAAGQHAAGRAAPIHAYDRFTADEKVKRRVLYSGGVAPFDGNDILPLARRLLAPWQGCISFHPGEIEDNGWPGGPIEILALDACKSTAATDAIAGAFFPHLVAGRSVVVHQDFLHWSQPWLPAQMELLAEYFTPLAHCPPSSLVYLCTAAPDAAALAAARTDTLSDDALVGLVDGARTRLSGIAPKAPFARMEAGLAANPGERIAWRFRKPAKTQ
ncbi:hypothetical protein Ga0609869_003618 [Rhodovulum iodosum]|uniref:Class I SAM-dependent methyltransferase n=1 Tax=Rhodovulum iodosum TaxID=68291 RepID=A0ABV3XY08_9RHOB|nr:hypothetical protein [Rhodovulum robiginosum]RSK40789.1 hypothetical protein EJA01_00310 [Rhodovulum robiginosum]